MLITIPWRHPEVPSENKLINHRKKEGNKKQTIAVTTSLLHLTLSNIHFNKSSVLQYKDLLSLELSRATAPILIKLIQILGNNEQGVGERKGMGRRVREE